MHCPKLISMQWGTSTDSVFLLWSCKMRRVSTISALCSTEKVYCYRQASLLEVIVRSIEYSSIFEFDLVLLGNAWREAVKRIISLQNNKKVGRGKFFVKNVLKFEGFVMSSIVSIDSVVGCRYRIFNVCVNRSDSASNLNCYFTSKHQTRVSFPTAEMYWIIVLMLCNDRGSAVIADLDHFIVIS